MNNLNTNQKIAIAAIVTAALLSGGIWYTTLFPACDFKLSPEGQAAFDKYKDDAEP